MKVAVEQIFNGSLDQVAIGGAFQRGQPEPTPTDPGVDPSLPITVKTAAGDHGQIERRSAKTPDISNSGHGDTEFSLD